MTTINKQERFDAAGLLVMSKAQYEAIHRDYRGTWTTERDDTPNWAAVRDKYVGKRCMMREGGLWVEGIDFVIEG